MILFIGEIDLSAFRFAVSKLIFYPEKKKLLLIDRPGKNRIVGGCHPFHRTLRQLPTFSARYTSRDFEATGYLPRRDVVELTNKFA